MIDCMHFVQAPRRVRVVCVRARRMPVRLRQSLLGADIPHLSVFSHAFPKSRLLSSCSARPVQTHRKRFCKVASCHSCYCQLWLMNSLEQVWPFEPKLPACLGDRRLLRLTETAQQKLHEPFMQPCGVSMCLLAATCACCTVVYCICCEGSGARALHTEVIMQ